MIYTVTFNPSLDYIVAVDNLKLGATNRTSYEQMLAGGKGINVSYVLKNLGVDAETKAKAQKDIAEDGYWGVEQTSDRIVSFATALAGDDSKALEKMRDAFVKGYKQAEKQWGGKLPDISQRTYDAVMKKFDSLSSKKEEKSDSDGKVIIKDNTTTEDTANPLA